MYKLRRAAVFAAFLLPVGLTGCGGGTPETPTNETPEAGSVVVSQEGAPFSFTLPEAKEWVILKPEEGSNLPDGFYLAKAPNTIMKLTYLPKVESINTLPKAVAAYEKEAATLYGEGTKYERLEAKNVSYDGVVGQQIEYAVSKTADGKTTEARVALWMGMGKTNVYAFQLIDQPETYAANRDNVFAKVLKSVKFKAN